MAYTAEDYSSLVGMEGFSETLLKNHFTLYQGYVANTNKLLDSLSSFVKEGKVGTPEYSELKRRMGFEFNGMRLHEYYFDNLGGDALFNESGKLGRKIAEDFGSYKKWEKGIIPFLICLFPLLLLPLLRHRISLRLVQAALRV